MQILGLLSMCFDAVVAKVKTFFLLLFRLARIYNLNNVTYEESEKRLIIIGYIFLFCFLIASTLEIVVIYFNSIHTNQKIIIYESKEPEIGNALKVRYTLMNCH